MSDFEHARRQILMEPSAESPERQEKERRLSRSRAYDPRLAASRAHRVHKVTIVPRAARSGSTQTLPSEDRPEHLRAGACAITWRCCRRRRGGEADLRRTTVGAENDLERRPKSPPNGHERGMSDRLGPVSCKLSEEDPFLGARDPHQRQFS